ncbi:MAG: nucleotidyltransferase family protein [Prochlorothrix sp.]
MPTPFLTPLLDAYQAQRRAQNEADRQRLLTLALGWLQKHGQGFGFDRGYLFGSITQAGRFTEYSDIDVAVESLGGQVSMAISSYLMTDLDRDVDLVPLDRCHFAAKIRREGILWIASIGPDSKPISTVN